MKRVIGVCRTTCPLSQYLQFKVVYGEASLAPALTGWTRRESRGRYASLPISEIEDWGRKVGRI